MDGKQQPRVLAQECKTLCIREEWDKFWWGRIDGLKREEEHKGVFNWHRRFERKEGYCYLV